VSENAEDLALIYARAIALENAGKRPLESFCKCNRVLVHVAQLLGLHDPVIDAWLFDETLAPTECECARIYAFYDPFVAAVKSGDVCEGQGNFGSTDEEEGEYAPAHPKFLEVRLTPRGIELVR
jgi:hypothetical protein